MSIRQAKLRVMIHVQHLLGIGHLQRSALLAASLAKMGCDTHLLSGGRGVPHLPIGAATLHPLPPVYSADATFTQLLDQHGKAIDDHWRERRRRQTLALFERLEPDVLITETFPFGRRMLRFEYLPLIEVALRRRLRPLIVASVRDILQPKSTDERNREVLQWLQYYDRVLVHADPAVSSLQDTFPYTDEIAAGVHYSGYITAAEKISPLMDDNQVAGSDEVIVSAGGGSAGLPLLSQAIKARAQDWGRGSPLWRVLVGHDVDQADFRRLKNRSVANVIVERNRSDFPSLLKRCRVSISLAGYNTVMDILRTTTPSVLVPFAKHGEVEQTLRAQKLQALGRVQCLSTERLSAQTLLAAVERARKNPMPSHPFQLDGARRSAELIIQWHHERTLSH